MKEFNQVDQEQIASMMSRKAKANKSSHLYKGLMRTNSRLCLSLVIVLMILTIVALAIANNNIKTKYSSLFNEEYDIGKEFFILRYKDRTVSNEIHKINYDINKIDKENDDLDSKIQILEKETNTTKSEIARLEKAVKIVIKDFNDKNTLINRLKQQSHYYNQKIIELSGYP